MDPADASPSDQAMIALLPTTTDWCTLDLPHMTLVYAGPINKLKSTDFNELAKDACAIAAMANPFYLTVQEKTVFGPPEDQVDVFRLMPTTLLWAMRRTVEDWSASEFEFTPHVTIGPVGTNVEFPPKSIGFDRVYVGWGDEQLTFMMTRGGMY